MKRTVKRVGILLLAFFVVCGLAASAFAVTYPYEALFDNRYLAEAYGSITATKVSASLVVYDLTSDSVLRNVYRHARVDYQFYPTDGGGLLPDYRLDDAYSELSALAVASTTTDSGIYQFRFAKFTFQATIPAASGGNHNWETESNWKEYTPT